MFSIIKLSVFKDKVKEMIVDQGRCELYSSSGNTLSVVDLKNARAAFLRQVECKNLKPNTMVLDEEMQMLYVGTCEGLLVIFDVSHVSDFVMVHYIKLTRPDSKNFIKQMDLDKTKNILMCRMKSSDIICIQLIRSNV